MYMSFVKLIGACIDTLFIVNAASLVQCSDGHTQLMLVLCNRGAMTGL